MKIIYYFKNLKPVASVQEALKQKFLKIRKFFKKEDALIEIEIRKDKEVKYKEGVYKSKIIADLPKRSLIIVLGIGKNIFQAIENAFRKLKRKLKR